MGWESSDVVTFDLGPSFKVKRQPNLKVLIISGILILYVFYYCFYMFAMSRDTPPARNKAISISLVIIGPWQRFVLSKCSCFSFAMHVSQYIMSFTHMSLYI